MFKKIYYQDSKLIYKNKSLNYLLNCKIPRPLSVIKELLKTSDISERFE